MLITNDFIFYFESEDIRTLFENIYGENWQEKVLNKQHLCFKDDVLLSIYLNGLKRETIQEYFESFILGFIFLNAVNPDRNNIAMTSSTMVGLITQACLATSEIMGIPPTLFFESINKVRSEFQTNNEDFENPENPKEITLVIRDHWVNSSLNAVDEFIRNGWVFPEKFDPTSIGEDLVEEQNDLIFKPTNLFLHSLNIFKIEEL